MFETLLVPLDGSSFGEQALGPALAIAERTGAAIELLEVHTPHEFAEEDRGRWEDFRRQEARTYLERVAASVEERLERPVAKTLLGGDVAESICEHAAHHGNALIVMATHGRTGFSRLWLGSVADGVVRRSPLPVLLVRAREDANGAARTRGADAPYRRILVTLDGSQASEQIIEHALSIGRLTGAHVHFLSVHVPTAAADMPLAVPTVTAGAERGGVDRARRYIDEMVTRYKAAYAPYELTGEACEDLGAASAILHRAKAWETDIVALATHGRGVSRLLAGSVADKVLRGTTADVLTLRPMTD